MRTADFAAITVAIVATVAATLTLVVLYQVIKALQLVKAELASISPVLDELRDAVAQSQAQVDRVDVLVGTAQAISARIDSASRVAQVALSAPVIKVASIASGTKAAARKLRRADRDPSTVGAR